MTYILGEVKVRAELHRGVSLLVEAVYYSLLVVLQVVGQQVLAYQLHITVNGEGRVREDVLGRADQVQGRYLVTQELQSLTSCHVTVSGWNLDHIQGHRAQH